MNSSTNLQGLLWALDVYKTFCTLPGKPQILLPQLSAHVIELQAMRLVEIEDGRKGKRIIKISEKSKKENRWVHRKTCKTHCKVYL